LSLTITVASFCRIRNPYRSISHYCKNSKRGRLREGADSAVSEEERS
jgi:hypothetical protein